MCFVPSLVPPILGPNTEPYGSSFASDVRGWTASGTGGSDMAICGAQEPHLDGVPVLRRRQELHQQYRQGNYRLRSYRHARRPGGTKLLASRLSRILTSSN